MKCNSRNEVFIWSVPLPLWLSTHLCASQVEWAQVQTKAVKEGPGHLIRLGWENTTVRGCHDAFDGMPHTHAQDCASAWLFLTLGHHHCKQHLSKCFIFHQSLTSRLLLYHFAYIFCFHPVSLLHCEWLFEPI